MLFTSLFIASSLGSLVERETKQPLSANRLKCDIKTWCLRDYRHLDGRGKESEEEDFSLNKINKSCANFFSCLEISCAVHHFGEWKRINHALDSRSFERNLVARSFLSFVSMYKKAVVT